MRIVVLTIAAGVTLTACGNDGSNVGPPASQLAFTAQPSLITAGQAISPAVQVSIEDASGNLVTDAGSAITLELQPSSGGATLDGTTTVSASSGVATFADLQITKPGTGYTLSASAPGLANATSTAFDVTPAPGVAAAIQPLAGQGQSAMVGQPVGTSPAVRVVDGLNGPVANVTVTFEVTGGGGSVSEGEQTTGADGVAMPGQWTLGTLAGSNTLLATAPELQGSPVSFTAFAMAGPAAKLVSQAGDGQTTTVRTAVPEAPAVFATDIYDNPVGGVPVTFRVASGGGHLLGRTQATGADGVARVESWILGAAAGLNTLTATSAGLAGSPVTFSATATHGVVVEVRNNYFYSRQNGSGSPVTDTDIFGKAAVDTIVSGETVTWVWVGQHHNVSDQDPWGYAFPPSGNHDAPHTFSVTFSTGTYYYVCTNHSFVDNYFHALNGMRGVIVVR